MISSAMRVAALLLLLFSTAIHAEAPDWSGWWEVQWPTGVPLLNELSRNPPPLRPDKLAQMLDTLREGREGRGASIEYCRPNEISGFLNGPGFEDRLEFLFTPGRVTLTSDIGLLRRFYLQSAWPAEDPPDSPPGLSMARWEGEALVVETRFLSPTNRFPAPIAGMPAIGERARLVERIRLIDADTLEIHSVLTAPDLLAKPYEHRVTYRRNRQYLAVHQDQCPLDDRLIDPRTGYSHFDLTPPADLGGDR